MEGGHHHQSACHVSLDAFQVICPSANSLCLSLIDEVLKVIERQFFMQQKPAAKAIKAKKEE